MADGVQELDFLIHVAAGVCVTAVHHVFALDRFDSSLMDFDDIDDETVDEEVDE